MGRIIPGMSHKFNLPWPTDEQFWDCLLESKSCVNQLLASPWMEGESCHGCKPLTHMWFRNSYFKLKDLKVIYSLNWRWERWGFSYTTEFPKILTLRSNFCPEDARMENNQQNVSGHFLFPAGLLLKLEWSSFQIGMLTWYFAST